MDGTAGDDAVRCLSCGCEYELPERAAAGEGCPHCGYPAWVVLGFAPRGEPRELSGLRKIHLFPVS